jgi:hypothetical protein
MKRAVSILLCIVFLTICGCNADVGELKVSEITAEVVISEWRSSYDYSMVTFESDGEPHETTVHTNEAWYLSLRSVKGISDESRKEISSLFGNSDDFSRMVADSLDIAGAGMLISVKAPKTLLLREKTRVKITNCEFRIGPFGIGMKCSGLEILKDEGKAGKPIGQLNNATGSHVGGANMTDSQTNNPQPVNDKETARLKGEVAPPGNPSSGPRQPPESPSPQSPPVSPEGEGGDCRPGRR